MNADISSVREKLRKAHLLSREQREEKINNIDVEIFNNKKFNRYIL